MTNSFEKVTFVEIGAEDAGQRLDNFLIRTLKGVPKSRIYRLLRKGEVRVNKGRVKAESRLQAGDVVRLPPIRVAETPKAAVPGQKLQQLLNDSILFEDEGLLVINKPSGVAVHGGSGLSMGVIEAFRAMRPEEKFLELVHRLDRDTSGCLVLARKRAVLKEMHAAIQGGQMEKRYLALVRGDWPKGKSTVNAPLRKNELSSGERVVRVDAEGKPSVTHFKVLSRFKKATLMEVLLETGRTHQIRVHCQSAGHPLAGDIKYGDEVFDRQMKELGLRRLFLHASYLRFRHPLSGDWVELEAPLPSDLAAVVERLS